METKTQNRLITAPENAIVRTFPEADVTAYCYTTQRGPALLAYKGRRKRPAIYLCYRSETQRETDLANYIKKETKAEEFRRERREAVHGLAVGDILYTIWGYEQTNASFYQVVRLVSDKSAVIQEVIKEILPVSRGAMSGVCVPCKDKFRTGSIEMTRRAVAMHTLSSGKDKGMGPLTLWKGNAVEISWYA